MTPHDQYANNIWELSARSRRTENRPLGYSRGYSGTLTYTSTHARGPTYTHSSVLRGVTVEVVTLATLHGEAARKKVVMVALGGHE